jgi:hypothetical protein
MINIPIIASTNITQIMDDAKQKIKETPQIKLNKNNHKGMLYEWN